MTCPRCTPVTTTSPARCSWSSRPSRCRSAQLRVGLLGLHAVGNVALLVGVILFGRQVRRASGREPSPMAELAVGAACVAWFLPGDVWNGHLAEVGIPFLWMTAALLVRRGSVVGAAVLLALSAGLEPWGVLAAPLLLHDLRLRSLLRGGTVFALGVAAQYLPFVLTGEFGLFQHTGRSGTAPSRTCSGPARTSSPGTCGRSRGRWRRACAPLSSSCSAGRSRIEVVWLAPAAAVLGRLLLDPTMFSYYLVPVCLAAIVGAGWCLDARSRWLEVVSIAAMIYLPFLSYGALALPSVVLSLRRPDSGRRCPTGRWSTWFRGQGFLRRAVNRTGAERVAHSEV